MFSRKIQPQPAIFHDVGNPDRVWSCPAWAPKSTKLPPQNLQKSPPQSLQHGEQVWSCLDWSCLILIRSSSCTPTDLPNYRSTHLPTYPSTDLPTYRMNERASGWMKGASRWASPRACGLMNEQVSGWTSRWMKGASGWACERASQSSLILSGQVWTCSFLFNQVWSCLDQTCKKLRPLRPAVVSRRPIICVKIG